MLNFIFGKKSQNLEFTGLLSKAYLYLQNKEFDKAVALYNELYEKHNTLPEEQKTVKLEKDIHLLFSELRLYLKINEAYIAASEGDMRLLHEELDRIHDIAYEIPLSEVTSPMLDYASAQYKIFLNIYTKKAQLSEFESLYNKIEKLLEKKNFREAVFNYSHLAVLYQKLSPDIASEKKVELYFNLRALFKKLAIHSLMHKKSQKPLLSKSPLKNSSKSKSKTSTKPLPKTILSKSATFEEKYEKIHELLRKGELKEASKLYKKL